MNLFTPEEKSRLPRHVGIIMDETEGGHSQGVNPDYSATETGVENVRSIVNSAKELGIPYITLYAFSQENQNRPISKKHGLMKLLEEFLKLELKSMERDGIRLRAIGDLEGIPDFARKMVMDTVERTKNNQDWNLTLALNYGSRQEVINAVPWLKTRPVNWKNSTGRTLPNMQTNLPDPDLIIRTSGEFRLSNFLLFQCRNFRLASPLAGF